MLNPQSPIPLYHQLADLLSDQIRSGRYQPGDLIPSENGMAKTYKIGRPTVRQAMDRLVRKGLIERRRGAGTFVKTQCRPVDIFSLAGTSQAFLTQGIQTATQIVRPVLVRDVHDGPENPFTDAAAFSLSRITLVEDQPVLLEDIYLHPVLFKGIDTYDFETASLSMVVCDHYHLVPEAGHQTYSILVPDTDKAGLLGLVESEPILEVRRLLDFPQNPGAVFSRLFCRTDRFAFSQTIRLDHV